MRVSDTCPLDLVPVLQRANQRSRSGPHAERIVSSVTNQFGGQSGCEESSCMVAYVTPADRFVPVAEPASRGWFQTPPAAPPATVGGHSPIAQFTGRAQLCERPRRTGFPLLSQWKSEIRGGSQARAGVPFRPVRRRHATPAAPGMVRVSGC